GGALAALWVPSLLAGGLGHLQAWGPPAVLLLTARLVIRAWSSERVAARGPVLTLAAGLTAAVLALAVGIGLRVIEVPDAPEGEADLRYVAQLPPIGDANTRNAGREFRTAADRYARAADRASAADRPPGPGQPRTPFEEQGERLPRD